MRTSLASLLTLVLLGSAGAVTLACGAEPAPLVDVQAIPADHLEIVRGDRRLADTTVDALQALPSATQELKGTRYTGVPLRELLRAQGVDPGDLETIEAIGADGYTVQLSGDELRADSTIVAHEADGAALRAESGPLRLITAERAHALRQLRRLRIP